MPVSGDQNRLYERAASEFGGALLRLARAYEADPEKRRDLVQEIHLALWRSFSRFAQRCSLRTWVYRVAHNTGASWVIRQSRHSGLMTLEQIEALPDPLQAPTATDHQMSVDRLLSLVQQLKPIDRQVILSYLEGLDAAATAEITGLSASNVATRIHRIKNLLKVQLHQGVRS